MESVFPSIVSSTSPRTHSAAEKARPYPRKKPDGHIPRPQNQFMLFRSHWIATAPPELRGKNKGNISKIVGAMWNKLSEEERLEWQRKADIIKEEHRMLYPDYKFQPVQKKKPKQPTNSEGPSDAELLAPYTNTFHAKVPVCSGSNTSLATDSTPSTSESGIPPRGEIVALPRLRSPPPNRPLYLHAPRPIAPAQPTPWCSAPRLSRRRSFTSAQSEFGYGAFSHYSPQMESPPFVTSQSPHHPYQPDPQQAATLSDDPLHLEVPERLTSHQLSPQMPGAYIDLPITSDSFPSIAHPEGYHPSHQYITHPTLYAYSTVEDFCDSGMTVIPAQESLSAYTWFTQPLGAYPSWDTALSTTVGDSSSRAASDGTNSPSVAFWMFDRDSDR